MSRKVINVVMGGSSSLEYIDVRQFDYLFQNADINLIESIVMFSYNFRSDITTQIPAVLLALKEIYGQQYEYILRNITALSIDFNIKFRIEDENAVPVTITIKEHLMSINSNDTNLYDMLNACPRLTEEEFYNLSK